MRVGIFTDSYYPHISGVSTSIDMLANALKNMGHKVYIVAPNLDNNKFIYDEKKEIIWLPGIKTGLYKLKLTEIYSRKAMKIIKEQWNLDIIHSQTEFGVGYFSRIVAKRLNIPVVHTYHTLYEDYVYYITHGHFDHVYCAREMKQIFPQALIMMNKNDIALLDNVSTQCAMAGVEDITLPCVDGLLDENTKNLKLGETEIKVLETKGHSKGGVCYLINNILFSGDTLFCESIGRTDLFGGSFEEIIKSIKQKLFVLNDDTIVYPGHGESTTIGHEKKYNPYFKA